MEQVEKPEQAVKPKLKMLVAGGCHVFGHPLGEAYSFTAIAAARLADSAEVQVETLRVSLKTSPRIVESLQRESVDVLVMQIGNFECPVDIQRHIRRLLRRKRESGRGRGGVPPGSSSAQIKLDPEMRFSPTLAWSVRTLGRAVYDWLATALGHPLFEPEPFRAGLRDLLQQIATFHVPCVIAIAPLPCADAMSLRHRLHGGEVMRQEVETAGMLYLDAAKALAGPGGRVEDAMFAETAHLSREGQRLLGEAVAALIKERLSGGNRAV